MATYGITPEGFVLKERTTILDELDVGLKGILGESAGTEPDGSIPLDSVAGQIKVLIADGLAETWELLQAISAAFDTGQAENAALDALAALTGTIRNEATNSVTTLRCFGDYGTALPVGRIVRHATTLDKFSSTVAGTMLLPITNWSALTAYAVGDVVSVFATQRIYWCTTAGTSDASAPTGETDSVTDNSVVWRYLGRGLHYVDVEVQAIETGPIGAAAGTLTDIRTPVSGWNAAINLADVTAGSNIESDPALRARRDAELAGQSSSSPDGIYAAVSRVNAGSTDPSHQPPTAVRVFYNDTDYTDADGLPPHSVEVLVRGGTDQDIAEAVFASVAAGTRTYGNQTSTVVDSEGVSQTVRWSRPEEVEIYVDMTIKFDAAAWPTGSETLIAQAAISALLTQVETFPIAQDVRVSPLMAYVLTGAYQTDDAGNAVVPAAAGSSAIPGLLEVESLYIGTTPSPSTSTQLGIQSRQVAVFDTTRTTATAVAEEP